MELDHTIKDLASTVFGIQMLRPFQSVVIQRILELDAQNVDHKGLLVTLPTGSGKSLCFMLPSLLVEGLTVIVYPLRSLMNDQVRRFTKLGIACIAIQGGQSREQRKALFSLLDDHRCKVVITNAECLSQQAVFCELAHHTISLLVVDEAHTIVRWGEGFRPVFASLAPLLAFLPIKQILCFTATADQAVIQGLNDLIFTRGKPHLVRCSSDRPNISYHVFRTLSKDHTLAALLAQKNFRPALVFCNTRESTLFACNALQRTHPQIPCRYYHAGLDSNQRKALESWFGNQQEGVLFSTNAFGMGVDKSNIRTVIHRELPDDALSYLQESGRGGRDGRQSRAFILLDGTEKGKLTQLFFSVDACYRESLLAELGESLDFCNGCDVCSHTVDAKRQGEDALLGSIAWHPLRYSPSSLSTLLTSQAAYNSFSKTLSSWRQKEIRSALLLLLSEGKVCMTRRSRRLYLPCKTYVTLLTAHHFYKKLTYGTKENRACTSTDLPDHAPSIPAG